MRLHIYKVGLGTTCVFIGVWYGLLEGSNNVHTLVGIVLSCNHGLSFIFRTTTYPFVLDNIQQYVNDTYYGSGFGVMSSN